MIAEAIEEILRDQCTPAMVRSIENGQSPAALWESVAGAGFLELLAAEEEGGAGLTLPDLFPILTILGRHAVPVPIAQSIAARALLARHVPVPTGMLTLAPACHRTDDGQISCPLTPYGLLAEHVLVNDGDSLLVLPCARAERTASGVRGSLNATLTWNEEAEIARIENAGAAVPVFGAALHAALLAGALSRVFEMTMQYANDRSQFGKPIGKFQAIQHQISVMAEHVAAASIAAEMAFQGEGLVPALLPSAIAKSRASEAVVVVASTAHAVHGAIGVTEEYDLQLFTRRLHEWRMAHGSEAYWNQLVGRCVLDSALPTITDFVRSIKI